MPAPVDPPTLEPLAVSAREAARLTGLSRSRVYELIAAGELEAVRSGARILIKLESVRTWFASLPEAAV